MDFLKKKMFYYIICFGEIVIEKNSIFLFINVKKYHTYIKKNSYL